MDTKAQQVTNAIEVLQDFIYKSVNKGLFFKSFIATNMVRCSTSILKLKTIIGNYNSAALAAVNVFHKGLFFYICNY